MNPLISEALTQIAVDLTRNDAKPPQPGEDTATLPTYDEARRGVNASALLMATLEIEVGVAWRVSENTALAQWLTAALACVSDSTTRAEMQKAINAPYNDDLRLSILDGHNCALRGVATAALGALDAEVAGEERVRRAQRAMVKLMQASLKRRRFHAPIDWEQSPESH